MFSGHDFHWRGLHVSAFDTHHGGTAFSWGEEDILLNGHGGNIPTLNRVCIELSQKGALGVHLNWWVMAGN